jgi:hypothetical protein
MMDKLTTFERGLLGHLIADWLLQNEWIATQKSQLKHPAAWLHAGIHMVVLGMGLGWMRGVLLAVLHLLIDTRLPLRWWQTLIGQQREGLIGMHIAIWADQVAHLACIGLVVGLLPPQQRASIALRRRQPNERVG